MKYELSFFTGGGGGVYASKILGHKVIGYVEIGEFQRKVIRARIEDGIFDNAPIFSDIRKFISEGYAERYRGMVDVISGGFPCQDISSAGSGKGLNSERSGLWREYANAIRIIRPRNVFVENSPLLSIRGLRTVLSDLAEAGYDARWGVLGSEDLGLPSSRKRLWIFAGLLRQRLEMWWERSNPEKIVRRSEVRSCKTSSDVVRKFLSGFNAGGIHGTTHGMADFKHRVITVGNGQVPELAARAYRILDTSLDDISSRG